MTDSQDLEGTLGDLRLSTDSGPIFTVKFSENGDFLASGGTDKTIKLWDLSKVESDTDNFIYEENVAKSAITWIEWSKIENNQVIFSSIDKSVSVFDLNKSMKVKTFKHPMSVNQFSISKKDTLITACDDGIVRIFDKRQKAAVSLLETEYKLPVLTCCTDSNENRFYFSGINPSVNCFDYRKVEKSWSEDNSHNNNVTSLSLSADETYLLSKSVDGTLKYYDCRLDSKIRNRSKPYVFDGTSANEDDWLVRSILINDPLEKSTSEPLLNVISGSGSNDYHTYIWEFASRKLINRLDGHSGIVYDVDFSSKTNKLVTCSHDGSIILRNL